MLQQVLTCFGPCLGKSHLEKLLSFSNAFLIFAFQSLQYGFFERSMKTDLSFFVHLAILHFTVSEVLTGLDFIVVFFCFFFLIAISI